MAFSLVLLMGLMATASGSLLTKRLNGMASAEDSETTGLVTAEDAQKLELEDVELKEYENGIGSMKRPFQAGFDGDKPGDVEALVAERDPDTVVPMAVKKANMDSSAYTLGPCSALECNADLRTVAQCGEKNYFDEFKCFADVDSIEAKYYFSNSLRGLTTQACRCHAPASKCWNDDVGLDKAVCYGRLKEGVFGDSKLAPDREASQEATPLSMVEKAREADAEAKAAKKEAALTRDSKADMSVSKDMP